MENGVKIVGPLESAVRDAARRQHVVLAQSGHVRPGVLEGQRDQFNLDLNDEILKGAAVTHQGQVLHEAARTALAGA